MCQRYMLGLVAAVAAITLFAGSPIEVRAADPPYPNMSYYPYYYFPHNYWPQYSPQWPEKPGQPYVKPPAYMAYPPFREPNWRYELWMPQKYYRGSHFWLDQF